jgi:peptidoglycan hydrolase-like protein with peptidoglycan-binding domain
MELSAKGVTTMASTAGSDVLKKGSEGAAVRTLQENLNKFGYGLNVDGNFGDATYGAVVHLQKAFGYTVDGMVGPGTQTLITQQIGYNWNKNKPTT